MVGGGGAGAGRRMATDLCTPFELKLHLKAFVVTACYLEGSILTLRKVARENSNINTSSLIKHILVIIRSLDLHICSHFKFIIRFTQVKHSGKNTNI